MLFWSGYMCNDPAFNNYGLSRSKVLEGLKQKVFSDEPQEKTSESQSITEIGQTRPTESFRTGKVLS